MSRTIATKLHYYYRFEYKSPANNVSLVGYFIACHVSVIMMDKLWISWYDTAFGAADCRDHTIVLAPLPGDETSDVVA